MKSYKVTWLLILLIILFIKGCASHKSLLEIPLRNGEDLSGDQIRFRNLTLRAVSDAILKIRGEQWPLTHYNVSQASENSYHVEVTEVTQYYQAIDVSPSTVYERKITYNVILKAADDGSIIMKIEDGRTWVSTKGQPFKPNTTYRFFQSQRPGGVSGRFIKSPPVISEEEKERFIRQSVSPQLIEMNEKAKKYYLKDFALLVEKHSTTTTVVKSEPQVPKESTKRTETKDIDLSNHAIRIKEMSALAETKDPQVVETMIDHLNDKDYRIQIHAIHILGQIRDQRAVEPLIAALQDPNAGVRNSAAFVLGQMGDNRAVDPLTKVASNDKNPMIRATAETALRQLKDSLGLKE